MTKDSTPNDSNPNDSPTLKFPSKKAFSDDLKTKSKPKNKKVSSKKSKIDPKESRVELNEREKAVLTFAMEGKSLISMSAFIGIAPNSCQWHLNNAAAKLRKLVGMLRP